MSDERREYQRLNLTKPLDGWFGDEPVKVLDVSARGAQVLAQIASGDPLPLGTRLPLRFQWRGEDVALAAVIVRTGKERYGVHFVDPGDRLRQLIRESAVELLRAQEANAFGDREKNLIGDESLTAMSRKVMLARSFVIYELTEGGWKSRPALLPDQPDNGFTVIAEETEEQIDLLCRTFETGDEEARRMIRMIAELSVSR